MHKFSVGEYVRLANGVGIHGTFSVKVPNGALGVVREREGGTVSAPSYRIKFENGEEHWVGEGDLVPA